MKSMFFKNLARGLVVVSAALALVNCNETTTAANDTGVDSVPVATGDTLDPALNPVVDPTLDPNNPVVDPNNPVVDPNQLVVDPANPSGTGDVLGGAGDPTALGTDPDDDPCLASSLLDACGTNPQIVASSSSAAVVTSSSSEELDPVSSSSEKKVESSSSAAKADGIFLATDTDENKDQMEITYIENIEPCIWDGQKNRNLCKILAYPKRLSSDKKHAVVMWGPGGGSDPKDYGGIIKRLASHGFVVVAIPQSPGDATQGKPALDWLESKNNDPSDPLYNKLDMTKVGCSGHSMGGLESEQMVIKDNRVITAMLNNSGDLGHTAMSQVSPNKTIGIVYGEGGMERPNAEADYNNQGVKAPACLLKMTGGQGNECQMGECGWGHGSGPWGGMAATVAWMRWHLGGDDFRKSDFVGSTGKYIDGAIIGQPGKWKGQCKNF